MLVQSGEDAKYTDSFSAEGQDSPNEGSSRLGNESNASLQKG